MRTASLCVGTVALFTSLAWACGEPGGLTGPLGACVEGSVPTPLSLALGESHRIDGDAAECFTVPRDGAEYLLTIANLGTPTAGDAPIADPIAVVRLESPEGAAPTPSPRSRASTRAVPPVARVGASRSGAPAADTVSREEIQNLIATAQADDRVWIPDRWNDPGACTASPDRIPVFEAVVVAIDGGAVIAADSRVPNLGQILAPETRGRLQRIAETIEAVYLPTMRVVISRTFQPPGGASGRFVTLITGLADDIGTTILYPEASPRTECTGSIEVSIAVLPENVDQATDAQIAGTAIHEHTHGADLWLGPQIGGGTIGTSGWATEALATTAQEQAARILAGARAGFRQDADDANGLQTWWPATRWPGTVRPELQPLWGPHAARQAAYGTGGLLLLFVREQLGETWPDGGSGPRLYERLAPNGVWSLETIAALSKTPADELYDRFVLAVALDDRLPAGASPSTLPQFETWDNSWRRGNLPDETWRPYESQIDAAPFDLPLAVGAGTYGIWRLGASSVGPGTADLQLRVTPVADRPAAVIRITRYR